MSVRLRALIVGALATVLVATLLPLTATTAAADTGATAVAAGQTARRCDDRLARVLSRAGFEGDDLREAWAIAMRESRGTNLGPGHPQFNGRDYGLFQFNRPTFGGKRWWNTRKLLTADYNAAMAHRMSGGGSNWVLWGLDGQGRPRAHLYRSFGWTPGQIQAWVVRPYERFYRAFPC